ncbi:DUF354 domain-containing protein [Natronoglomus mannanivorans]|uniref:DUF354 domain-containing protein n=1 Tax=Natronoglomus mannanivorans TaxID=2979990 RepID=A0AAP2YZX9_9EURY|nr:DUF354 domain-containing protein [Halobacteria archaeon AArc-xg1-1]
MRVLVLANTPAHVHTYRYAVERLETRGHDVLVLVRDAGCAEALAAAFELPYEVYGAHDAGPGQPFTFARQLGGQFAIIARRSVAFDPDVVFGRGPYAAFAGTLARAPVVLVLDDEPGALNHALSSPVADCVLSPAATRRNLGPNHYTFEGFLECAYLHPDVFDPDPGIRDDLGVDPDEPYVLVRVNAHTALHDRGTRGFTDSQRRALIEELSEHATVFVSDEGGDVDFEALPARPYDCHPARIHDVIAEADLLVADTGTVVTEAALLGTPAVRYTGTETYEFGEFAAIEAAGLAVEFASFDATLTYALDAVTDDDAVARHRRRRDAFVADLVNPTELFVSLAAARGSVEEMPDFRRRRRTRSFESSTDPTLDGRFG